MIAIASIVLGFLLGSIPFGLVVGRVFFGVDIRAAGSGNIGAANALRTIGKGGGAAVFALDIAKGWLPAFLPLAAGLPDWVAPAAGAAAVLGHTFSPWLGGKGGKGVATALGALLAMCWPAALAFVLTWVAAVALTRFSSVGSMLGMWPALAVTAIVTHAVAPSLFDLAAALFVLYTHRANLARLRSGNEHRLTFAKRSHAR